MMVDFFDSAMAVYPNTTIEQLIRNWSSELRQAKTIVRDWPDMIRKAEEELERRKNGTNVKEE